MWALLPVYEIKVTLGNDLFSREFLVKTNLDEGEDHVETNRLFYTNFSLLGKTKKGTNLSMGTVLYGIWKI